MSTARKVLTIVAVIAVVVVIGGGVMTWLNSRPEEPGSLSHPPEPAPPATEPVEPDWCPEVEVIATPGTWESSPDDDPFNPTFQPNSYMLSVTQPLQQLYDINDVRVWTTPYTAQFKSIHSPQEASYDDSRANGTERVKAELTHVHNLCPRTDFILVGFSQGAVISGDIADEIGAGTGVVPADKVRGVALIADGRREEGVGINPGAPVSGIGAEISLAPVNNVIQFVVPGATMTGPRPHKFGELADRTMQICALNDHICDSPHDLNNAAERALAMVQANGVHAAYAINPHVFGDVTTSEWIVNWIQGMVQAPTRGA